MSSHNDAQSLRKPINTLLKIAVLHGSTIAVQFHIEKGHDLNASDEKGLTSLMLAALKGHACICNQLIHSGADPLLLDNEGRNALDFAKEYGHSNVVELLRKYIPNLSLNSAYSNTSDIQESASNLYSEDHLDLDLSEWEEEVESLVPINDESCLIVLSEIQQRISNHIPVDKDHDWLDVEIDLPAIYRGHLTKNIFSDDLYSAIYSLISYGKITGFIPYDRLLAISSEYNLFHALEDDLSLYLRKHGKSRHIGNPNSISYDQLNEIAFGSAIDGKREFLRHILLVFGDMSVFVADPYESWSSLHPNGFHEYSEDALVDEAVLYLSAQLCQNDNPLNVYLKHMGRQNMLSREDEEFLGREIAQSRLEIMEAIAQSPYALKEILLTAKAIQNGELPISVLITKDALINPKMNSDEDIENQDAEIDECESEVTDRELYGISKVSQSLDEKIINLREVLEQSSAVNHDHILELLNNFSFSQAFIDQLLRKMVVLNAE